MFQNLNTSMSKEQKIGNDKAEMLRKVLFFHFSINAVVFTI